MGCVRCSKTHSVRRPKRTGPAIPGGFIYASALGAPGRTRTCALRIRGTDARNPSNQAILAYGLGPGDVLKTESVCRPWTGQ